MDEAIVRNIPALTSAECKLLGTKKICVVGCGGLGGYIIELMTRIGIGGIRAVDGDTFDRTNLNRQLLCTAELIGTPKVSAAVSRIHDISPGTAAEARAVFLDAENAAELIEGCDAVFDALDNIPSRRILCDACGKAGIPYVFGAISGWVAQAALGMPGDRLTDKLYPGDTVINDKSVLSFTPAICASMQVSLCVRLLTGRECSGSVLYYFDALDCEFERIGLA